MAEHPLTRHTCCCWLLYALPAQFTMLRDIDGQQFADAVSKKLGPRMQLMGECTAAPTQYTAARHDSEHTAVQCRSTACRCAVRQNKQVVWRRLKLLLFHAALLRLKHCSHNSLTWRCCMMQCLPPRC